MFSLILIVSNMVYRDTCPKCNGDALTYEGEDACSGASLTFEATQRIECQEEDCYHTEYA